MDQARQHSVHVHVLPSYEQLINGNVAVQLRSVKIDDLLRRDPVELEMGNIRQWIVAGVGVGEDVRRRQEEFDQRGGLSAEELLARLSDTLDEVDRVLASLPLEALEEPRTLQGMEVTVFEAVYHVVEHFSMHVGQIIYLAKARRGRSLDFYEIRDGKAMPHW